MVGNDVVFVTHEAQRSGAPMALLNLLRWLRATSDLSFSVVAGADGPLVEELAEVAPVALAGEGGGERFGQARLVYANSSWSHPFLDKAPAFGAPVISHVHELRSLLAQVDPLCAGKRPQHWVAVSDLVQEILVTDYGVGADEVTVCKPFVPVDEIVAASEAPSASESVGAGAGDWTPYGVPAGARVVGAVGSLWPNKGPDLFLDMAAHLIASHGSAADDVHFVWIGGPPFLVPMIQSQVDQRDLGSRVHMVGELRRPYHLMKDLDAYVVPSRDDAFPLVALEAGALRQAVVAFDCGGGVSELLADGRGVLVGREDLAAMAGEVVALLGDAPRREQLGGALERHVREHHDVSVRAPRLLAVIESQLGR